MSKSGAEAFFIQQWSNSELAEKYSLIPDYKFLEDRKFLLDFAIVEHKIAVEVEGAVYASKGRHTSGAGYSRDIEKYNIATSMGWKVLRITSSNVKKKEETDKLFQLIEDAIQI